MLLLALFCIAAAAPLQVRAGTLSVAASDTEIVARTARGQVAWRFRIPGNVVDLGVIGPRIVVFAESGSPEYGTARLLVWLLRADDGTAIWKRALDGTLGSTGNAEQTFPGWGTADDALWVTRNSAGEMWHYDSFGFGVRDGTKRWEEWYVGHPRAQSDNLLLFRDLGESPLWFRPENLDLIVVDARTGHETRLSFEVQARPGCGKLDDGGEGYGERADARFFYASRHDDCGDFTARYDWHAEARQVPVVTPAPARKAP